MTRPEAIPRPAAGSERPGLRLHNPNQGMSYRTIFPDWYSLPYTDNVAETLLDALSSMAVVSTESMQHQNFTEVMQVFAIMFERLPAEQQGRAEDHVLRLLSTLGDEPLSAELDRALGRLIGALTLAGHLDCARAVQVARDQLAGTVGQLNSRSTRAQSTTQSSGQSGS